MLYKGRILLLDTVNFEFSKYYISENVERVLQQIEITKSGNPIENVRDFSQGDYILNAIRIYADKIEEDNYTDLNLWSFSNSGTGASCEIDRIPNRTFRTLYQIYRTNSKCQEDLKTILKSSSARFLECMIEGKDYYGLYPRKIKIKKGKKAETIKLEGVNVAFYEAYQKTIKNDQLKAYAKYIAYLISEDKELKTSDIKLLEKFEPHKEPEYNTLIYGVLLRGAQRGQWSLQNHLEILDKADGTVIRSWIYGIFKMVHFYFFKKAFLDQCPAPQPTELTPILSTIVYLIEMDVESKKSIDRLQHPQKYETFNINWIFTRNSQDLDLGAIVSFVYDDYRPRRNDLNKLLRLYFNQDETNNEFRKSYLVSFQNGSNEPFKVYQSFVETFQDYYLDKYNNDIPKYEKHILKSFPTDLRGFKTWIGDALEKMNTFYSNNRNFDLSKLEYFEEELFYAPNGEYNPSFSRFAIEFLFNQHFSNKKAITI